MLIDQRAYNVSGSIELLMYPSVSLLALFLFHSEFWCTCHSITIICYVNITNRWMNMKGLDVRSHEKELIIHVCVTSFSIIFLSSASGSLSAFWFSCLVDFLSFFGHLLRFLLSPILNFTFPVFLALFALFFRSDALCFFLFWGSCSFTASFDILSLFPIWHLIIRD